MDRAGPRDLRLCTEVSDSQSAHCLPTGNPPPFPGAPGRACLRLVHWDDPEGCVLL